MEVKMHGIRNLRICHGLAHPHGNEQHQPLPNVLLLAPHAMVSLPSILNKQPLFRISCHHFDSSTPLVSFRLSGMILNTGAPTSPFSPGWLVPLSMPTAEMPESEATGACTFWYYYCTLG